MALNSEFIRKRDAAIAIVAKEKGRLTASPLGARLLWNLGIPVRPPHYQSFGYIAVIMGSFWFLGMTALILLFDVSPKPLSMQILAIALGSTLFGVFMAAVIRRQSTQLRLPPWDSL
jgi:hypothetical protein